MSRSGLSAEHNIARSHCRQGAFIFALEHFSYSCYCKVMVWDLFYNFESWFCVQVVLFFEDSIYESRPLCFSVKAVAQNFCREDPPVPGSSGLWPLISAFFLVGYCWLGRLILDVDGINFLSWLSCVPKGSAECRTQRCKVALSTRCVFWAL